MWKTPRRKPFKPEGITLGAEVRSETVRHFVIECEDAVIEWHTTETVVGQVWAKAGRMRWWVVTTDGVAHDCYEGEITVLGQCIDVPLFESNAA